MRQLTAAFIVGMSIVGCTKSDASKSDSVTPAGASVATKVGESVGFNTPESVKYDSELDVFYVSNINGNPSMHDGNGFISIVRADSVSAPSKVLVQGGQAGAKLDAPKGLALVGDTLWVADINHVRAFNRKTGATVADIDLSKQNATFLNDVAVGGDGSVYVTDTGIRFDSTGNASHPGTDQIFKISGRKVSILKADSLNYPNGIAWDAANSRFVVGPFNGTSVVSWKEGDKVTTALASGPGQYDGVEVLSNGRVLVSSWTDSTVDVIQDGKLSRLVSGVSAPADIGFDSKRSIVAVPRFNDGKVEYFRVP